MRKQYNLLFNTDVQARRLAVTVIALAWSTSTAAEHYGEPEAKRAIERVFYVPSEPHNE
jgi:hypothetical protein